MTELDAGGNLLALGGGTSALLIIAGILYRALRVLRTDARNDDTAAQNNEATETLLREYRAALQDKDAVLKEMGQVLDAKNTQLIAQATELGELRALRAQLRLNQEEFARLQGLIDQHGAHVCQLVMQSSLTALEKAELREFCVRLLSLVEETRDATL